MAITPRLVDLTQAIKAPTSYSWQAAYRAALLETDWTKMVELVTQRSLKYTKGGWSFLKTLPERMKNVRQSSMR